MAEESQKLPSLMGFNLPLSLDAASAVTPGMLTALAALPIVLVLVKRVLFPTVGPREPPVLRPTIPFIGHIVSMIREKTSMFDRLYKENPLPICSLPMLNGWMYVVNDPSLIAAAMRHRHLSFDPFTIEFASSSMGMTKAQVEIYSRKENLEAMTHTIHKSLTGDNVLRMNVQALGDLADAMNGVRPGEALDVPDVFEWLRNTVTVATTNALFGKNNPFGAEDANTLWEFEKGVGLLALGIAQSHIAPNAFAARKKGQEKLQSYYVNRHDEAPDASAIVKNRAALHRSLNIPDDTISLIEYSMPFVATSNTIPTLCWFFLNVFASPDLVARIRDEVAAVTRVETDSAGARVAADVDVSRLEKGCPTLFACYREALRLYSDAVGNRRVMEDTTLRDPNSGREYLLRKGINVQWPARLAHSLEPVWGEDVGEFRPERWLGVSSAEEKARRGAMIPFGGGKTLCPGRYFAQAENLGLVGALALGFNIEGATVPESTVSYLGTAVKRPVGDKSPSIRVSRREGWEGVEWRFSF